jgi:hypothetical protein
LSRHRKIHCSTIHRRRSKAIAIVAAGAFSVATAASAVAATWPQGTSRPAASGGHDASSVRSAVTGRLAPPRTSSVLVPVSAARALAPGASQALDVDQAQQTDQIKALTARITVSRWQAAREKAAANAAAARAAAAAQTTASPTAQPTTGQPTSSPTPTPTPVASGSPQQIAEAMLGSFGWSSSQFSCLDPLWAHESGWSVTAYNAGSGAYGIPQALPGSRMASAGPNWQTNAATQIRWGLEYIKSTYGSPCAAWDHEQATGWY